MFYRCEGEYIRHLTGVKGVSWVVDPYNPYRWNEPFSICTRSENCISLRVLRVYFMFYRCEGGLHGLSICTVHTDFFFLFFFNY